MTFIINKQNTEERSMANDLVYGLSRENNILNMIQTYWSDAVNISNTKDRRGDQFCKWDYESDDGTTWELKSRRINHNQYPTALLSHSKVRFDIEGDQFFVFNYLDKVVWCKYDKEIWKNYNVKHIKVFRKTAFGDYTTDDCWEIPINTMVDLAIIV